MKRQQPHITSLLIAALLLLGQPMLFAELIVDGEVQRSFKVENTADFPDYNFYYRYQSYDLENDQYVPAEIVEVPLSDGVTYMTALGEKAILIAKPKSGIGDEVIASKTLGGVETTSSRDLHNITDVVKITRLSEEAFTFKVVQFVRHFDDGTTQVIENSKMREVVQMLTPGSASGVQVLSYTMLPILIIVFLFLIQLWRRRHESRARMGRIISIKKRVALSGTDSVATE